MRILTIDALSAQISAQVPILARFGARPKIVEDARQLYELAAERLLKSIAEENDWSS